jgi:hypothetical protein
MTNFSEIILQGWDFFSDACINLFLIIFYNCHILDTSLTVQTSIGYRTTALHINKNWLMYRALYQQICSSDQLLHTSTNIAKKLTQIEKERKNVKCPKSKFIRICLKERIHREKEDLENPFCGYFMLSDFLLRVYYTEGRKTKNKMENFLNLNSGLPHRELPQREKRLREKT